jgi:hypothetical protein
MGGAVEKMQGRGGDTHRVKEAGAFTNVVDLLGRERERRNELPEERGCWDGSRARAHDCRGAHDIRFRVASFPRLQNPRKGRGSTMVAYRK